MLSITIWPGRNAATNPDLVGGSIDHNIAEPTWIEDLRTWIEDLRTCIKVLTTWIEDLEALPLRSTPAFIGSEVFALRPYKTGVEAKDVEVFPGHRPWFNALDPSKYLASAGGFFGQVTNTNVIKLLAHKTEAEAKGVKIFIGYGLDTFGLEEYFASAFAKAEVKAEGVKIFFVYEPDTFGLQEYLASARDKAGVKAEGVVFYDNGLDTFDPQKHRDKGNTSVFSCERQYATVPLAMTSGIGTVA